MGRWIRWKTLYQPARDENRDQIQIIQHQSRASILVESRKKQSVNVLVHCFRNIYSQPYRLVLPRLIEGIERVVDVEHSRSGLI